MKKIRFVYGNKARVLNIDRVLLVMIMFLMVIIPFTKSAGELVVPFSITETKTDYGIAENTIWLEVTDLIDKAQYITNISEIFANHPLTDEIEIKEILLKQDYLVDVYGDFNETYEIKKVNITEICSEVNETNETSTCYETINYYDASGVLLNCNYVINQNKTCLITTQVITGTETKQDYFNLPTLKEKIVINGLKIEQKQSGLSIPLPKNGTIYLKIRYSHPFAYRLEVLEGVGKYDIEMTTADGTVILDPWWNSTWLYKKEINITNTAKDVTDFQVELRINTTQLYDDGKLQADCDDIRFTNSTESGLSFWQERCVTNDNSTLSIFWVEVDNLLNDTTTSIYMYYDNTEASSASSSTDTFGQYLNHFWTFNNNPLDLIGNAGGVITGNVLNATDRNSLALGAYEFDGAAAHVRMADDLFGSGFYPYSVHARFKFDGATAPADTFFWNGETNSYTSYNRIGSLYTVHRTAADGYQLVTTAFTDTTNWHTTATTLTANEMKLYVDRTLSNTLSSTNFKVFSSLTAIGAMYDVDAFKFGYHGLLDSLRFYNTTLETTDLDKFDISPEPTYVIGAEEQGEVNTAPTITANATSPSTVYSNTDFKLNLTITDPDADTLTGYVQFYINGSSSGAEQSQEVTNNTNTLIGTLASGNFSAGDTLIAEFWAGDGTENTTRENATEVTVSAFVMGGTVKDSSNIVVNNAKVIIIDQSDNTIIGTTDSNSTGGWTYSLGSTGTYLVVAYDPNNSTRDGDADPHIVVS